MAYKEQYTGLRFEKKNHVGYVFLSNPKTLNALSYPCMEDLILLLEEMNLDRDIYAVIFTGDGDRAFCAGADLKGGASKGMAAFADAPFPLEANREMRVGIHNTFTKIAEFPKPTLAAINGYALGGGAELAACCDMRIASENAKIGYPEVHVGGIAAYTGVTRLARILSNAAAKEILFTGKHYTAAEMKDLGFVSKVVPQDKLMETAEEMMAYITAQSPIAVKYTKIMFDRCLEMSWNASLEFERALVGITSESKDFIEGMNAAVEKRKPVFKNE